MDLLAASSQSYGLMKKLSSLQTLLALSAAILGPTVAVYWPEYRAWTALWAMIVMLIDFVFLEPGVKESQTRGATIQEMFDTDLLQIDWNPYRCKEHLDPEDVASLASAYRLKHSMKLKQDWYPKAAGELPIEFGRLICQRANMRWDSALRRRYCVVFLVLLLAMIAGACGFAIYHKWDADKIIISLVLPLFPTGIKLIREMNKHRSSAESAEKSKRMLEDIWKRAMTETIPPETFRRESRALQDELFDRRSSSPSVPEWLYQWLQPEYERTMVLAAEGLVEKVKERLGQT